MGFNSTFKGLKKTAGLIRQNSKGSCIRRGLLSNTCHRLINSDFFLQSLLPEFIQSIEFCRSFSSQPPKPVVLILNVAVSWRCFFFWLCFISVNSF